MPPPTKNALIIIQISTFNTSFFGILSRKSGKMQIILDIYALFCYTVREFIVY